MQTSIKPNSQFMVLITIDGKARSRSGEEFEIDDSEIIRLNAALKANPQTDLIKNRQIISNNEITITSVYRPGLQFVATMLPTNKVAIPIINR